MSNIMDEADFERVLAATGPEEDGRMARRYIARHATALRSLLQRLADLQNGSPLPKYDTEYNELMSEVWQALKEAQR